MIDHYRTAENLEWRAFVKYGLPAVVVAGLFLAVSYGLASEYPAMLVISLTLLFAGFYLEGRKSVHGVALLKLLNVSLMFIAITLSTGNPLFAVLGISASFVLAIVILQKT